MNKLLYGILFLLISTWADAQSFYALRRGRSLIASFGVGNATYFGDLQDPKKYFDSKLNITGGLQYFVHPNISVRGELTYFQLQGDDSNSADDSRVRRNLSFHSSNFEASFTGAFHLFPNTQRFYQRRPFNLYAFAGIGVLFTNPKADIGGKTYALQPLKTEGVEYGKIHPVIPYGIGAKIKMGPFFNLALEAAYRKTFTDYLDDVSTVHPDKSTWTDPVRIALSDRRPEAGLAPAEVGGVRGNPSNDDGYMLINVKIEYYLANNFLFRSNNYNAYKRKRRAYYR